MEEAILTQGHTEPPSTIAEYQALAKETDVISAKPLILPLLGFFGEVGSLVSELKKKQRDEDAYIGYKSSVVEEIGDVLWYLACVCSHTNTHLLSDLFSRSVLRRRRGQPISKWHYLHYVVRQEQ